MVAFGRPSLFCQRTRALCSSLFYAWWTWSSSRTSLCIWS